MSSRLIGLAQGGLRWLMHNPDADVVGARREPGRPWMSLIALVADEQTDATGATTQRDEKTLVGAGTTQAVQRRGYLYAYPNDAFGFYGNNSGTIELTVTRQRA